MSSITLKDLLTASGKYPQREKHKEVTAEVITNGKNLIDKVNRLLKDLGISQVVVSSGFRPSEVNGATPNAAKKSLHMTGQAIDIEDTKDQYIAKLVQSKEEASKKGFLVNYGLWLEHPDNTKGANSNWAHFDCSTSRANRKVRVFKP